MGVAFVCTAKLGIDRHQHLCHYKKKINADGAINSFASYLPGMFPSTSYAEIAFRREKHVFGSKAISDRKPHLEVILFCPRVTESRHYGQVSVPVGSEVYLTRRIGHHTYKETVMNSQLCLEFLWIYCPKKERTLIHGVSAGTTIKRLNIKYFSYVQFSVTCRWMHGHL